MKVRHAATGLLVGLVTVGTAQTPQQQGRAGLADPSNHRVRFVAVDGVRVPFLDWGGTGTAMVFIPGFGNSAHVYDDFAPRFTKEFHVLGVTRVGFGESDQPTGRGYDLASRVAHITAALDSAKVRRAILIGHSLGGDELTGFAAAHPDRTIALIYLDAAIDHTAVWQLEQQFDRLFASAPKPSASDLASPQAYRAFLERLRGIELPIGEVLATTKFDSTGRRIGQGSANHVFSDIVAATISPEFTKVRAPTLALYSDQSAETMTPWAIADAALKAKSESLFASVLPALERLRAQFRAAVPGAQTFAYPAHHYQFLTRADDTERRMRDFLRFSNIR